MKPIGFMLWLVVPALLVLAGIFMFQDRLLYFPAKAALADLVSPALRAWPSAHDFRGLVAEPVGPARATAIVFLGNAGHAGQRDYYATAHTPRGLRVILAEYPGYGPRGGALGERTFVDDAEQIIDLARGKYLTVACVDDRHKADAYERMVAVLEARPDIALVYANSTITMTENETFEKHSIVGNYRWGDFDPHQLLFAAIWAPSPCGGRSFMQRTVGLMRAWPPQEIGISGCAWQKERRFGPAWQYGCLFSRQGAYPVAPGYPGCGRVES